MRLVKHSSSPTCSASPPNLTEFTLLSTLHGRSAAFLQLRNETPAVSLIQPTRSHQVPSRLVPLLNVCQEITMTIDIHHLLTRVAQSALSEPRA